MSEHGQQVALAFALSRHAIDGGQDCGRERRQTLSLVMNQATKMFFFNALEV